MDPLLPTWEEEETDGGRGSGLKGKKWRDNGRGRTGEKDCLG